MGTEVKDAMSLLRVPLLTLGMRASHKLRVGQASRNSILAAFTQLQ